MVVVLIVGIILMLGASVTLFIYYKTKEAEWKAKEREWLRKEEEWKKKAAEGKGKKKEDA